MSGSPYFSLMTIPLYLETPVPVPVTLDLTNTSGDFGVINGDVEVYEVRK